jgi:hypothetical protein
MTSGYCFHPAKFSAAEIHIQWIEQCRKAQLYTVLSDACFDDDVDVGEVVA